MRRIGPAHRRRSSGGRAVLPARPRRTATTGCGPAFASARRSPREHHGVGDRRTAIVPSYRSSRLVQRPQLAGRRRRAGARDRRVRPRVSVSRVGSAWRRDGWCRSGDGQGARDRGGPAGHRDGLGPVPAAGRDVTLARGSARGRRTRGRIDDRLATATPGGRANPGQARRTRAICIGAGASGSALSDATGGGSGARAGPGR